MTKPKRIAIDFEFRDHKQATMSLVAVSAQVEGEEPMSWWLYQDEVAQADFKLWVRHYQERYPDAIWLAYGATAEAECFLTLGIDPREFRWHDLHTDFIQAQNGSPTYCHGVFWAQRRIKVKTCCDEERCDCTDKQMKSVGKATWQKQFSVPVIVNTKMEWEDERGAGTYVDWVSESRWQSVRFPTRTVVFDRNASFDERKKQENKAFEACAAHIKNLGLSSEEIKPNLLNATLRLCGIERDPRAKDEARDIILGKRAYSADDIRIIMEYAEDDTADLFAMDDKLQRILEAQSKQGTEWVLAARAWRGRAAANHAHLVRRGLRLHKTRLENLRRNKQKVFEKAYLRWNATVQPMFTWKNKERRWGSSTHAKNAFLRRICTENGIDDWERTARNDYSTSTKAGDALDRYADLVHQWRGAECEYDADGPLKGFQRFGKMQSSLNSIPELERDHGAEAEVGNDGYDDDVTMLSFLGDDLHLRPYFGLYGTQTGRNAPKATGFLPAKAAWLRALIDPEPGYAYVELDYSSQETFIAGAISGDAGILRAYDKNGPTKGDPYLAFAIDAELITQAQYDDYKNDGPDAKHVKTVRKLCKAIVLGCFTEETLVLTKKGWKPITNITKDDYLWDGVGWVQSRGKKYMGLKEVIDVAGVRCTPEHDFWIDGEWQEARHLGWDVLAKNSRRLPGFGADWAEVWQLVRNFRRSANSIRLSLCALFRLAMGK